MHLELIQIGVRSHRATPVSPGTRSARLANGPLVGKFFVAGALAMSVGGGWLGTHLWLTVNGQIIPAVSYLAMKQLHIVIQLYLFLGLFILGFIVQAGPKLFAAPMRPPVRMLIAIPTLVLGCALCFLYPKLYLGRALISLTFASGIILIYQLWRVGSSPSATKIAAWMIIGLSGFVVSPFVDLSVRSHALLFFWVAVGSIIFATGENFIVNFLNGTHLNHRAAWLLQLVYGLSVLVGFVAALLDYTIAWTIWSWLIAGTLVSYLLLLRLWRGIPAGFRSPLTLGFIAGYFWAIIGAVLLAFGGSSYSDLTLHIWATGWAASLIFAISYQIMTFISGQSLISEAMMVFALAVWQLVPFGRGIFHSFLLPPSFSWVVVSAASITIMIWMSMIFAAETQVWITLLRPGHAKPLGRC